MRRPSLPTFAAFSLVVTLATAALLIRTHAASDSLCWSHGPRDDWLTTARGFLIYQHATGIPPSAPRHPGYRSDPPFDADPPPARFTRFLGHQFLSVSTGPTHGWLWAIPLYQPLLLSLLLPTLYLTRTLRDRRRTHLLAQGLCPTCHYDLRSTPDATGPVLPRCPECGTATPQPHTS